jgi:hypothetical protein
MWRGRDVCAGLLVAVLVAGIGLTAWLARQTTTDAPDAPNATDKVIAAQLDDCLFLPAGEVVKRLQLNGTKWYWIDEPPGILRGVVYSLPGDRSISLYIAEGEPLYRQFSETRKWDYDAFLKCRVGGIQFQSSQSGTDSKTWNLGPDVPWQFR